MQTTASEFSQYQETREKPYISPGGFFAPSGVERGEERQRLVVRSRVGGGNDGTERCFVSWELGMRSTTSYESIIMGSAIMAAEIVAESNNN